MSGVGVTQAPGFLGCCICTWWHAVQANLGRRCRICNGAIRRATAEERRLYDRQMRRKRG